MLMMRQLFDPTSSRATYLLADTARIGKAVLIGPGVRAGAP